MEADKDFEMMELFHDKPNIPRLCLSHLSPRSAVLRELCFGDREGPVVLGAPLFFLGCYGHVFGSRPSQVKLATKVEHWYYRQQGDTIGIVYLGCCMLLLAQIYGAKDKEQSSIRVLYIAEDRRGRCKPRVRFMFVSTLFG